VMTIGEMRTLHETLTRKEGKRNLEDLNVNGERILIWTLEK
jgi:hypothetical protein